MIKCTAYLYDNGNEVIDKIETFTLPAVPCQYDGIWLHFKKYGEVDEDGEELYSYFSVEKIHFHQYSKSVDIYVRSRNRLTNL